MKLDPIIHRDYKKMLKRDILAAVFLIIPIGYIVYSIFNWSSIKLNSFYLFIILVIVGVIFEFINWKCPKCKKYIGMVYYPKYCPRCGERFR